jgi:hyperosmotically inducible periplasmic protein
MNRTLVSTGLATLVVFAGSGAIAANSFEGGARDAWLTGRIETMYLLNEHLNPFSIETDVQDGVVVLEGTVESEIDRDLAGALAKNIEGVTKVENRLVVDASMKFEPTLADEESGRRNFGSWVDDATTTAAVKSRLIRNPNTKGLEIDVDTRDDVVTLSGRVSTDEERQLAEEIALDTSDVAGVSNNLVVDPE